jgi:hypothetical protein
VEDKIKGESTSVASRSDTDKKESRGQNGSDKKTVRTSRTNSGRKSSLNADKVYQYIVGHKEARLKELEAEFSEVSGRTVRRMTDSLIKEGKIERVGNPGPTSFYKATLKENNSPDYDPSAFPDSSTIPDPSVIPSKEGIQSDSAENADIPQLSYASRPEAPSVIAL